MDKLLTKEQIQILATEYGIDYKALKAVYLVESAGSGFDKNTGKIKIQFEPHIFINPRRVSGIDVKKLADTPEEIKALNITQTNRVDVQGPEWLAFNAAWSISPTAAMLATSWGLGQIMGFNFKASGFTSVDNMVTSFKESEINQLRGMLNFIKSNKFMFQALIDKDWDTLAYHYNGAAYKKFNYHNRLAEAYSKA